MYETNSEGFEILDICNVEMYLQSEIKPEITLVVKGKEAIFLCDTGGCRTPIHPQDMPGGVKKKGTIFVKSANGLMYEEDVSENLPIEDPLSGKKKLNVKM